MAQLGDSGLLVTLGSVIDAALAARVQALAGALRRDPPAGLLDVVPAFAGVGLFFQPGFAPSGDDILPALERAVAAASEGVAPPRRVEIPVVYGGEAGPDLASVAAHAGMTPGEVINEHTAAEYLVHAVGFSPGFPYLGGLSPRLATPRRKTPRPRVPAGSVGIGGEQTGVYPLESPGGWNLIGRTPLRLFDATRAEPSMLQPGDLVRFQRVADAAFPTGPSAVTTASPRDETRGVEVLRPGMLTTVQDLGRPGHRAQGLPVGGAADAYAMRVANLLVGNDEGDAGLEFTLVGPELRFAHSAVIAVCGAEFDAIPGWRPIAVSAGQTLNLGPARRGCRGYLAISGGVTVPSVLGSRSTYARAGLGGLDGRSLRAGDVIPVKACERRPVRGGWYADPRMAPDYFNNPRLRVIEGLHRSEFPRDALDAPYVVSRQSDRMGARLEGPSLARSTSRELLSAPVAPGTVQVPPDGKPIILLADAQTIGGYPRLGHVASVDMPIIAQRRPGDSVRFEWITRDHAVELASARERAISLLGARVREIWK